MQHTLKRSALVLACVAAALSLAGCGTAEPETSGACSDLPAKPEAIDPLAERIGIMIPATARPVHAASITGMDDAIAITLDMPETDWPPFWAAIQAQASTAPPPFSAAQNAHLGPDSCGWSPGKAAGLETTQIAWHGGNEALNVGVAPRQDGKRVYLFWHQL